jgi:hypothetical protein
MNYKFKKIMKEEIFYAGHIGKMKEEENSESILEKIFDYSLWSYSHRER